MKFLIVEPSLIPILIPLGPKYSSQNPVFKSPLPAFLPYRKRPCFKSYSTTGNIIVLYRYI